jgi:hypothetical protein
MQVKMRLDGTDLVRKTITATVNYMRPLFQIGKNVIVVIVGKVLVNLTERTNLT